MGCSACAKRKRGSRWVVEMDGKPVYESASQQTAKKVASRYKNATVTEKTAK